MGKIASKANSDLIDPQCSKTPTIQDEKRDTVSQSHTSEACFLPGTINDCLSDSLQRQLQSGMSDTGTHVSSLTSECTSDAVLVERDSFQVERWCGKKFYSDLIEEGLKYLQKASTDVVMLFESPSSSSTKTSFHNSQVFAYHDYPATSPSVKLALIPLRYSSMNGSVYPAYLHDAAPTSLQEHWAASIPGHVQPTFVPTITAPTKVYAYLPVESIRFNSHINDPYLHYHLAGKDSIHLMTSRTTKLLTNTHDLRPCVAKVTHATGSRGIFVIHNDQDEQDFRKYLAASNMPTFVVTEFVDIGRNVACHFFIHPSGKITWFGSNENVLLPDGSCSTDSTILVDDQDLLRDMQLPYVKDVVSYCHELGFWGLCGIDVLFDHSGRGYVVDVNPRATGSCPAIMIAQLLKQEYGFRCCMFRSKNAAYPGSAAELLAHVKAHNEASEDASRVVVLSMYEESPVMTLVNLAAYSYSAEECQQLLNVFAPHTF